MATYYCRRCDKDGVTGSHRCFYGFNAIIALKKKPNLNTPLARKLAKLYEKITGHCFPGGIENAKIISYGRVSSADLSCGNWKWRLGAISGNRSPINFGSTDTATNIGKLGLDDIDVFRDWEGCEVFGRNIQDVYG